MSLQVMTDKNLGLSWKMVVLQALQITQAVMKDYYCEKIPGVGGIKLC